jgi:hypothetical protein
VLARDKHHCLWPTGDKFTKIFHNFGQIWKAVNLFCEGVAEKVTKKRKNGEELKVRIVVGEYLTTKKGLFSWRR